MLAHVAALLLVHGLVPRPQTLHTALKILPFLCAEIICLAGAGGLAGAAGLLLVAGLLFVADLLTAMGRHSGVVGLQIMDAAVRVHPLPPGWAVIGAALGPHTLRIIIVCTAAGLAADRSHGSSSLSWFFAAIILYVGCVCLSTSGCGEKFLELPRNLRFASVKKTPFPTASAMGKGVFIA